MRLVHFIVLASAFGASPAYAATASMTERHGIGGTSTAFAAPRMNDAELASITGTGVGFRFFRDTITNDVRLVEQQNGQLLVTAFDNWFTDVGTPLIFSNIAGRR